MYCNKIIFIDINHIFIYSKKNFKSIQAHYKQIEVQAMNKILDPNRIEAIFMDCMFKEGEDTSEHIPAEGIVHNVGFHPGRLKNHQEEIEKMLAELPDGFNETLGGGMSFLSANVDKQGKEWTSLHLRMEQLFQLGIGIGKVECLLSREYWYVLPGRMPYYVIT